jgi:hypothetical protein
MLFLLRIIFTGAFVWLLWSAANEASANLDADVANAGRFALAIVVGFVAALTWAPLVGDTVAGPATGLMTDGSVSDDNPRLVRWAKRSEARGRRGLAVLLAFLEGVRRPRLPAAFVIGMNNARPGSWLEYVFAREVWRFNSVVNCLRAYDIMVLHHDRRPPMHSVPEVNLALMANLRQPPAEAEILPLPAAPPPPPLQRNQRIKLFADEPPDATDPAPRESTTDN